MAYIIQLMIESENHPEARELSKATGRIMHTLKGKHWKVRDAIFRSVQFRDLVNDAARRYVRGSQLQHWLDMVRDDAGVEVR
jgi:hypothetical protein